AGLEDPQGDDFRAGGGDATPSARDWAPLARGPYWKKAGAGENFPRSPGVSTADPRRAPLAADSRPRHHLQKNSGNLGVGRPAEPGHTYRAAGEAGLPLGAFEITAKAGPKTVSRPKGATRWELQYRRIQPRIDYFRRSLQLWNTT